MAKKYVYYYKLRKGTDDVIDSLYKATKVAKGGIEITEDEYNNYFAILNGIEEKDGFVKHVVLFVDGTYKVEYVPIIEEES